MRRLLISTLGMVLLLAASLMPVGAHQAATPESTFTGLGLPELNVTVTSTAYEGIPAQLAAGRYLVSVTIADDAAEFGGGIAFVQPSGMTADEFLTASISAFGETGGQGDIPEFLFDATYGGGTYSFDGSPGQLIVDLIPGEWIAWADDPEAPQQPVIFEATGEMPTALPEPESDATITMGEYVIDVTEGELTSGSQVVRIDNQGAQPHFVGWFQVPDGTTETQVHTALDEEMQAAMTGTPAAWSGLNPDEDLMPVIFTATQSTGTSIWVTVNVSAGTHGLLCFFPDIADGMPHANHGMYSIFEVGD
jgi:hypothetical protein